MGLELMNNGIKQSGNGKLNNNKDPVNHSGWVPHHTHLMDEEAGEEFEESYVDSSFALLNFDRWLHAAMGRATKGVSPAALIYSFTDWWIHLAMSPGKQAELAEKAGEKAIRLGTYTAHSMVDSETPCCINPLPQDRRFASNEWNQWPYNFIYQSFLLNQQWWHDATKNVRGMSKHHSEVVSFAVRQILDLLSPANFIHTNPEILSTTASEGGMNLVRGFYNYIEDQERSIQGRPAVGLEDFSPGKTVAITPGKVVYRNKLMELIQYAPTTKQVHSMPVLIVPAWIMKYYILDLSPHNSLVKYLVDQGYTVFMISWKNPTGRDRNLGMADYRKLGIMTAIDIVTQIAKSPTVHGVGYCLGGTLLSIVAAAMSREEDNRLQSVTLLAAQTDFTDAGELTLFIDDSQVTFLEDMMWEQGYLDGKQMSGAFQLLRSKDLIWSRMIHDYLLGKRRPMFDLMAWNADSTRLPYRMHTEYLKRLFLKNELADGCYQIDGRPIALSDVEMPVFAVGTVKDHVSPWRSVYKIHLLIDSDVTFLLTSGGHNAGITSEPGHKGRQYQVTTWRRAEKYVDPDIWQKKTPYIQGSWWPEWTKWLASHSNSKVNPPAMGGAEGRYTLLCDAPGEYVLQK